MTEHVILVHGLWMRGFAMGTLSRRLQAAGFDTASFDYLSVARGPEAAAERLRERVAKLDRPVHLVGHSLGGLVALEAMRGRREFPGGRVVCLGSPLKGSRSAQGLAQLPFAEVLVGKSRLMLGSGIAPWTDKREVGVIAGRIP